jgi:hypothetical protein
MLLPAPHWTLDVDHVDKKPLPSYTIEKNRKTIAFRGAVNKTLVKGDQLNLEMS